MNFEQMNNLLYTIRKTETDPLVMSQINNKIRFMWSNVYEQIHDQAYWEIDRHIRGRLTRSLYELGII